MEKLSALSVSLRLTFSCSFFSKPDQMWLHHQKLSRVDIKARLWKEDNHIRLLNFLEFIRKRNRIKSSESY